MKNYILVLLPFLVFEWLVGTLRNSIKFFQTVFEVINFPLIYGYLWLEDKPSGWWAEQLGIKLINDEIAQIITFFLMAAGQALLITWILRLVGIIKKKSQLY